ncbi:ankyrin repeat protein, partial [Ostertagia ostertagi]
RGSVRYAGNSLICDLHLISGYFNRGVKNDPNRNGSISSVVPQGLPSSSRMTASSLENDLGVAILTKNESAVKTLIYNGVDVNRTDSVGSLPLHYAAYVGDTTMMMMLIDSGADLNAQDTLGLTPLHRAVAALRYDVAELLINKGCDTTLACKLLQTPLHICAIHNVPNVAALLLRNSVHYASLVQSGCDVAAAACDGTTPLHVAASLAESAKPIEYLIGVSLA